ncbi:MAG: hypothetical protein C4523_06865 [Myxococcales bacterium]|nr:MAG: hypothetical protein C4523_06865 [Myxococcales bacterium]
MKPRETIEQFDLFLARQGLSLSAVIIGGAALSLLGIISRETRDCDVLHPQLPDEIIKAQANFAAEMRGRGIPLQDDWLNNNPMPVANLLPEGWLSRTQVAYQGTALTLLSLSRSDILLTKLFAYCDRGTDLGDCLALKPTAGELKAALPWIAVQDANPDWPRHVEESIRDLGRRLGHEL